MSHSLKQIAAVCAIALLCTTMVLAAKRGIANVHSYLLQAHLNSWSSTATAPTEAAWDKAKGFFQTAINQTPKDPQLLQYGGILHEWRIAMDTDDTEIRDQHLNQSIEYYRTSTRQRPTWPYAWMNLAVALNQAGQNDTEFQYAFGMAIKLGPWESTIVLNMAELGLHAWQNLTPENKRNLRDNIQNAATRNPGKAIKIAEQQNRLLILCYMVKGNKPITKHCRKKGFF
ncbi:hypothetical protein MNBD_GAMMA26-962 [hydrothermal vent metagenome]|uniref:Uncharacterized protein n=1 Tax=hydrothermal vent metagenome TaxID=652676 RepID=A0A3B1AJV0_9ZZZZ